MVVAGPAAPIGLMGAMESETEALRAAIEHPRPRAALGCELIDGRLDGHAVLLATSGVGKVNAALTTAAMATAGVSGLLFTGVAGALSPELKVGNAVIATRLIQHDVDLTPFGRLPGEIGGRPAGGTADPALSGRLEQACRTMGLAPVQGVVASGDQFIADAGRAAAIAQQFGAIAVEMEGAAVAQVCARLRLPFAVLRWISDAADDQAVSVGSAFTLEQAPARDLAVVRAFLAQRG